MSMNETHIEQMNVEIRQLKEILDCKTFELKKIYEENTRIREAYEAEKDILQKENSELKNRIKKLEADYLEELELFKVKMAQLIDADIQAITKYYENEVEILTVHGSEKDAIITSMRDKVYQGILDNDELRKHFEI